MLKKETKQILNSMIFDNLADAIFVADTETRQLINCNKKASELLGYTKEEILTFKAADLHPQEVREETMEAFSKHSAGEELIVESKVLTKDGKKIPVSINSHIIEINSKRLVAGIFRDITQEEKTRNELEYSENLYRTIFEKTGTGYTIIDQYANIVRVNSKFEELSGYSREELEGKKTSIELGPEEIQDKIQQYNNLRRHDPDKAPSQYESQIVQKNGDIVDILVNITKIPGTTNFIASILDISEQKRAEQALKENEEKYRTFVQNFEGIAFTSKGNYKPVLIEGTIEKITGYTQKDFLEGDLTWDKLIHPEDIWISRSITEDLHNIPNFKKTLEYRIVRKDEEIRWVRQFIQNITDEKGKPYMTHGAIYDITERKKAIELQKMAYEQIESNIQSFDILIDRIRNPLMTIIGTAELEEMKNKEIIVEKAIQIDKITKLIADRWEESEQFRRILREELGIY